jgi:hypothetical protein
LTSDLRTWRIREFFHDRGLEFPDTFRATEVGRISYPSPSYSYDREEWSAKYQALFARLGRGHKTLLSPVIGEPGPEDSQAEQKAPVAVGEDSHQYQTELLSGDIFNTHEIIVNYKFWNTLSGRVVSVAENSVGGSSNMEDLQLCLFFITKSAEGDAGRCFSQDNFDPQLGGSTIRAEGG